MRRFLFGANRMFVLCTAFISVLTGCATMKDVMNLQKPGARIVGVNLNNITLDSLSLMFDMEIDNPYAVSLPLVNVDYALVNLDKTFLSGKADLEGSVPAKGKKTVSLPVEIGYLGLMQVVQGVRPGGVVPYEAELGLSVDAPALGRIRLPARKKGELPVPTVPEVGISEIKWDTLTLDEAGGHICLKVKNRNSFPVKLAGLDYGLSLGGTDVAQSSIEQPVSLEADNGEGEIEIPISISPRKLGLGAFRMLTSGGTGYRMNGKMTIDTRFGPMSLPLDTEGDTVFRKTKE